MSIDMEKSVEMWNREQLPLFRAHPVAQRALFIARCVNPNPRDAIRTFAESLGYRVFVIASSEDLRRCMAAERPAAVAGIACHKELDMVRRAVQVPHVVILLHRCTCSETDFDLEGAKALLAVS